MAERIQRKRTKGWTMPENTVYVGRPGRWGNPFSSMKFLDTDLAIRLYADMVQGIWNPHPLSALTDQTFSHVRAAHDTWTKRIGGHPTEAAWSELRGQNLACWCPVGQPCHADALLELANR